MGDTFNIPIVVPTTSVPALIRSYNINNPTVLPSQSNDYLGKVKEFAKDPILYQSLLGTPVVCDLTFNSVTYTDNNGNQRTTPALTFVTVLLDVSQSKKIITTEIQGRDGTVKEYIGMDDYGISINGIITGTNGSYPQNEVNNLKRMLDAPVAIPVVSTYLTALGIYNIVVKEYSFDQEAGGYSKHKFFNNCTIRFADRINTVLMFRVLSKITFNQVKPVNGVARNGTLIYNFCHDFSCSNSWASLTDSGEIIIPKNVTVTTANGLLNTGGTNKNVGGFSNNAPLFIRGDKVKIEWGYAYFDKRGNEISPMTKIFEGYISQVTSKKPIVLKVEDNMFILKQTPAAGMGGRKFFGSIYKVEDIFRELFKAAGLSFTVNALTQTTIGDIIIQNESIGELLARFQRDYHFESYFRGNELRIGCWPYLASDAQTDGIKTFKFQQNIISDDLDYRRKDDVTLSAVVSNTIDQPTGKTTRDGQAKTKKVKLEALITFQNGSQNPTVFIASKGKPIPPSTGGERHQFYFWGVTDINELINQGTFQLRKYYYSGFKGKFTTFAIPYVQLGDYVNLLDDKLPERNGQYIVKSVEYKGGINGLRQEIELDYLIGRLDATGKFLGL